MKTHIPTAERPVMTYTAAAMKGMGDRAYQEDTYVITERRDCGAMLAMVADGMGGMQDGRLASRTAVSAVKEAFRRMDMRDPIAPRLREAVVRANDLIYERLNADGGSTGIACIFYDGGLYYAGVGDSFLLLRRGTTLYHLNRRQNMYYAMCMQQLIDGMTDRTFAERHPERHALTGYLGMKELRDVDMFLRPMPLSHGDTVMLCSDGIGDVLSDSVISACMGAATPEESCRRIEERVLAAAQRHQDNYTAVVIRITESTEGER